jgi:hypothetical protein
MAGGGILQSDNYDWPCPIRQIDRQHFERESPGERLREGRDKIPFASKWVQTWTEVVIKLIKLAGLQ